VSRGEPVAAGSGSPGAPPERVRRDFDRIALLESGGWDANAHYHDALLAALPFRMGESLDLGCGIGAFTRRLAERSERVVGIDLSPNMIRLARERSLAHGNITYLEADVTTWQWPRARFDAVASLATLHHLPFEETLVRMRDALVPGGTLAILDLFHWEGAAGFVRAGAAVPASWWMRLRATGRVRADPEVAAAWAEHGTVDRYMTLSQVRAVIARVLPGAVLRGRLFWRYTLVWRKPA
jgi:SAM-dependent methyltransferase